MRAQTRGVVRRHETDLGREPLQDVGGLRDHQPVVNEKGGAYGVRPGWSPRRNAMTRSRASTLALRLSSNVDVRGAGILERETHELTATLNRRPVIEADTTLARRIHPRLV